MPHDDRAVVVLERAGHELRRARRAAIDHDHERVSLLVAPERPTDPHGVPVALRLVPVAGGVDDRSLGQKLAGRFRRFLHAAAAVVAQVEHQALHAAALQPGERGVQVLRGLVGPERREADVPGLPVHHERSRHRGRLFHPLPLHGALDRHERTVQALALQAEPDRGALGARQAHVELLGALGLDRLRIHRDQFITRKNVELRRVGAGRHACHHR